MSYRIAIRTIVIWIIDISGEASAPIMSLLGRWRRWRSLFLSHKVRLTYHIQRGVQMMEVEEEPMMNILALAQIQRT
jgi:hypothetical protein